MNRAAAGNIRSQVSCVNISFHLSKSEAAGYNLVVSLCLTYKNLPDFSPD